MIEMKTNTNTESDHRPWPSCSLSTAHTTRRVEFIANVPTIDLGAYPSLNFTCVNTLVKILEWTKDKKMWSLKI